MAIDHKPTVHHLGEKKGGGRTIVEYSTACCLAHHSTRTNTAKRENVRWMVADGLSAQKIKSYFLRWTHWWVKTATLWDFQTLVRQFISICWHEAPVTIATEVLTHYLTELDTRAMDAR